MLISAVLTAMVMGYLAGLWSFKVKSRWCPLRRHNYRSCPRACGPRTMKAERDGNSCAAAECTGPDAFRQQLGARHRS